MATLGGAEARPLISNIAESDFRYTHQSLWGMFDAHGQWRKLDEATGVNQGKH